jgi:4-amino-4-deoxy-L-arabinose transferase-like glycosyltransferase
MFASGDYISTRLCGCLWFEKPPLLYWMSAAGYSAFGVNELAARLPSAAAALITIVLLYATLRHLGFPRLALTSSLVLATSGLFIAYARVAAPDMILTLATTASLLAGYLAARATGRTRSAYWALSFLFMGFAVLAKGLIGIVLVVAILGIYFFWSGQLRSIRVRDCLIGGVVFLVVAGTWYLPVTLRHGWAFIDDFFIRHHFQRYTTNEFGHPQPLYFFLVVAVGGVVPWTFLLIPGVSRLRSLKPRRDTRDSLLTLSWVWVAVPLLFFSLSESKLPGYILPIFPALALIIGAEVDRTWNGDRGRGLTAALWMTLIVLVGIGIGFIVYAHHDSVDVGERRALVWLPLMIALLAVGAVAARKPRLFVASAAGVVMSVILGAVILLFPILGEEVSLKSLSLEAAAALKPGEKIGFYLKKEFAPVFYAEGRVLCEPKRGTTFYALHQDMLADALESESSLIVITDSHWLEGLKNDPRFATEFIASRGESLALRVALKR